MALFNSRNYCYESDFVTKKHNFSRTVYKIIEYLAGNICTNLP